MLKVCKKRNCFEKDSRPFFYLADTVWSVFTNASTEDWEEYLEYRKMQGFTVLQINILPQWDRSMNGPDMPAFARKADGKTDFRAYNKEYFDRARTMLEMAVSRGFTPALVVLWYDYVKGRWDATDETREHMTLEDVRPYVGYIMDCFDRFNPIYIISGDTDFKGSGENEYYHLALSTIKEKNPKALTTMHMCSLVPTIPDEFIQSPNLDFYMYQSGHHSAPEANAYQYAGKFHELYPRRPVVNGEPCYEGIIDFGWEGKSRQMRFDAYAVRRAIWQSLLSGAKAGVTYGAQGIWNWHATVTPADKPFSHYGGDFPWSTALRFEGAWDAGFARWVFENYDLFGIEPSNLHTCGTEAARMSAAEDMSCIVLYIPFSTGVSIKYSLEGYRTVLINLADRRFTTPVLTYGSECTRVREYPFNSDALLIAVRE